MARTVKCIARSPWRPDHRRKNWFVGIDVLEPVADTRFHAHDIAWETMRASGPGGQHVNRTESAVRVTHRPTGVQAGAKVARKTAGVPIAAWSEEMPSAFFGLNPEFVVSFCLMRLSILAVLCVSALWAELTPAQRESDFRVLAAFTARYYAGIEWKATVYGINGLQIEPWLERIRNAKDDIEFHRVCAEYLAQFKDGHVNLLMESTFEADTGLRADIFDGKVLLYSVPRSLYPVARYPLLAVGNEVVSLDGKPALELVDELARLNPPGAGRAVRRIGAYNLFYRMQRLNPEAVRLPDTSEVTVRNPEGAEGTYTITWEKSGTPITFIPTPVSPNPANPEPNRPAISQLSILSPNLRRLMQGGSSGLVGVGSRNPYYALPAGFTIRRGIPATDNIVSGTWQAEGQRLGLIRLGTFYFSPSDEIATLNQLSTEITYMRANTDGLVLDVSRNDGGYFSLALALFARLTTRPFFAPPHRVLPSANLVMQFEDEARTVQALSREQWVIQTWTGLAAEVRQSYETGYRVLSSPIPMDIETGQSTLNRAPLTGDNFPWLDASRQPIGYDKPLVVLVDELTGSCGDYFAALVQDNRRAPLVGMRTAGLGGFVESYNRALPFSQASIRLTGSFMIRNQNVTVPGLPTAPLIEDLGVLPDIELDHQTRGNLMNQGRDFVAGFTRAILNEIRRAR